MIRFESDYLEGAVPEIMSRLIETNYEQTAGYGADPYCRAAREKIKLECDAFDADIHFLAGGTQANLTVITAALRPHQGVMAAETAHIEAHAPEIVEQYRKRIEERVRDILGAAPYDEARLLTEVAVFSDRVNVNEEIVRLKSHISQFSEMLASDEPVGRKIDFLIQEMNRETNTIGSKSNDLEASKIIINIKAEIEKLREQIQNVE